MCVCVFVEDKDNSEYNDDAHACKHVCVLMRPGQGQLQNGRHRGGVRLCQEDHQPGVPHCQKCLAYCCQGCDDSDEQRGRDPGAAYVIDVLECTHTHTHTHTHTCVCLMAMRSKAADQACRTPVGTHIFIDMYLMCAHKTHIRTHVYMYANVRAYTVRCARRGLLGFR